MLKSASRRLLDAIAAKDRDATRSRLKPWRAWYGAAEWRRIRKHRLSIEPLCRMCAVEGRTVVAAVVDHIRRHRGRRELFFSLENTQSLCKHCHDSVKQREERAEDAAGGSGLVG